MVIPSYDIEIVKVSYVDKYCAIYQQWNGAPGMAWGSDLWTTAIGKPIVYHLGNSGYAHPDVTVTYEQDSNHPFDILYENANKKLKNIVGDPFKYNADDKEANFAWTVNQPDSYATAYVYTGNLNNRQYSNQVKVMITTTYTTAAAKAVEHDLGATLTDEALYYTRTTRNVSDFANIDIKADGAQYVWEISAKQYEKLSAFLDYNGNWNIPNPSINLMLRAYINNTEISLAGITFLRTYVEQGIGVRYYLGITSTGTSAFDCSLASPLKLYLVWNNPDNTNESFKLHLEGNFRGLAASPTI